MAGIGWLSIALNENLLAVHSSLSPCSCDRIVGGRWQFKITFIQIQIPSSQVWPAKVKLTLAKL